MQCKDKHPLALAQQDIYLHQIQNGNNPMYNIGGLLKLTNIEPDKLKKAHECLIENHESFGLRIEEGSTGPRQYISAKRTKALNELDFSSHSKGPETALNWVNSEFQTSFSLYDCELYKAYLIRISENNYWYCFIAHHLMIDGWGFAKLIESLGEYYCGREPQGNTHWKKVIANDFSYLEGSQYLKDKAYWEQQITALPEPLLTPYYRSYFADPKCIPSGRKSMTIPSDKYTALNALAKHCGVGLAQVFLGLLATCLCRSYEKAQLLVGMPVHNRKRYDDKQHIGLFTSVSPMLVDIDKDARFIDLLKQLNDRQRRNFRHQKYPFGELVRRLGGVGHSGAALEVEYNYLKLKSNFEIGNGSASVHYLSHHHNPIPLSLTVWEFGDSQPTELHMDFNKAFFNDKEASLLLNRFYEMTLQFMADVELKVRDFSIISSSEQALISEMSIGPKVDLSEQLIHDAFVQRATDTPEKTALIFNNKTMSYGELNAVTNQLANYLSETYKNSEVPVIGVSLARSFELVISILATLKAGFTYVPLDPSLPKTRLDHIVNDTQLCCILTQRNLQPCFEGSHADITLLDAPELKQRLAQFSTVPALCRASADGLAYIFYTSGTTGKPKGVAVEHHSVVNRLEWGQKQYQLNSDDIVLQKTPFNFDVSVWEIFWPLRQGATMLLAKPEGHKDPDYICALMNEFEVSVVQFVPSMLHAYIQINPGMMPASLRYVFCSGEALGVEEVQYLAKHSPHLQVFNLYGPTEASIEVSHFACADLGKRHSVPIGKPIQNVSLHVLNTQREVCPIGVAGELFIGGICLAREYLNLAHLTSEHFQLINVSDSTALRLYKTGDLARYSVDGNIEYLGRNDHQVKIRGLRVELTEIEAVLNSSDQVNSSLVLPSAQNSLIAYVLCAHVNSQLSDVELIATLKETLHSKLPSYMVPEHFVFVTAWPMTANGKIDKKALPAPQLQSSTCFEAPTTQTQIWLVQCIAQLLNLDAEQISIGDNFFALGGHSLLAVKLVAQVRRALGKELSVQAVFESNDLKGLAQQITQCSSHTGQDIAPIARAQTRYALSHAQQRLWFIDRLQGGSPEYNMAAAFEVEGHFNVAIAEQALLAIIMRHEVLRSVMCEVEGVPAQQILDAVDFTLHVHDLTSLPASEQALAVTALVERDKQLAFDLSQDVMLRAAFIDLAPARGVLVLNLHHIAGDGWSIPLLVKEFEQGYRALLAGEDTPLAPLPIQYIDYAHWQREPAQRDVFAMQLAYWQGQLADVSSVHELPLDGARSAQTNRDAALWQSQISTQDYQQITQQASRQGMSVFMLLHSALALVLSRHSHSSDSVMGTPVANRQQAQLSELLGFFVNTVVLRVDTAQASLADYWAHVKATHLAAQAHQDVPFEQVVEQCCEHRSQLHSPLFQISFDVQFDSELAISLPDVSVTRMAQSAEALKFELEITVQVSEQGVTVNWLYDRQLFNSQRIERLSRHFTNVVHEMGMAEATQTLAQIPMLESDEQQALLSLGRYQGAYQVPTQVVSIAQQISQQAQQTPKASALYDGDTTLSYAQLDTYSNQLAHYLVAQGVSQGDVIGIYRPRSVDLIVSILAIWKAGAAILPLDMKYPTQRVQYMVQDAQAKWVLCDQPSAHFSDDVQLVMTPPHWQDAKQTPLDAMPILSNLAYLIYTSGSTGQPKGVAVSHEAIARHSLLMAHDYGLRAEDSVWQMASFSFDTALEQSLSTLIRGGCLVLHCETLPGAHAWLSQMRAQQITVTDLPVAYFAQLLTELASSDWQAMPLRLIVVGGEALPRSVVTQWFEKGPHAECRLINAYGPTEAVITACRQVITPADKACVRIGEALPERQLLVLDSHQQLVPQGGIGELYIGGVLAEGYWHQAALSAEKFIASPFDATVRLYRTGDRVRWTADGELVFEGRFDEQVKRRGFRIELGEIDYQLSMYDGVQGALSVLTEEGYLHSYVLSDSAEAVDTDALRRILVNTLPDHMIPDGIVVLGAWPMTANGKIDKKALPAPQLQSSTCFEAPTTQTQIWLVQCIAQLLNLDAEQISIGDNFFALGGHSLLAVKLVAQVRRALGKELSVQAVFESNDLKGLAQQITQCSSHTGQDIAPIARAQTRYALSHAQQRLWFIDRLQGGSPEYNMAAAFEVEGHFNVAIAEQALLAIIMRHEVLRSVMCEVEGVPAQQILDAVDFTLHVHDLTSLPASEQALAVTALVERDKQLAFDLSQDVMLRAAFIDLAPARGVLVLNLHHIAGDGWSIPLLVKEFEQGYRALLAGEDTPLAPLPIQYIDYAHWQREPAQRDVFAMQLAYWQGQLADVPTVHELPLDGARSAQTNRDAALWQSQISTQDYQQITQQASRQGMSVFMLLHSALALVLSRHSHSSDSVMGTPVANRQQAQLSELLGFFVNTVVLRVDTAQASLADYWAHVKATHLAAQAHQDVPFEQVVEQCCEHRSQLHSPLFQISFDVQFDSELAISLPDVSVTRMAQSAEALKFELEITVQVSEQGVTVNWLYDRQLFNSQRIERLSRHFTNVVHEMGMAEATQTLAQIPMLESDEQQALLTLGRYQGAYQVPTQVVSIAQQISQQAQQTPKASALYDGDTTLSYAQLDTYSNQLAHYLVAQGVSQGDVIGIYRPRSVDLIVSILAIWKAGAAILPLDMKYPTQRVQYMVQDAQAKWVLCDQPSAHFSDDVQLVMTPHWQDAKQTPLDAMPILSNLAYLIYTSGSTGQPKGVAVSHEAIARHSLLMAHDYGLRAEDSVWQMASFSFDTALEQSLSTLIRGGCLVLHCETLPGAHAWLSQMRAQQITVTDLPVAYFAQLLTELASSDWQAMPLRLIVVGGEALPRSVVTQWFEKGPHAECRLINAYGPTEAVITACRQVITPADKACVRIGEALPERQLLVLDSHQQLVPQGGIGELYIGGVLAEGYWHQAALSAEKFIASPFDATVRLYRTGDRVRWTADGELVFEGRFDEQVKRRGFRIELGEIDYQLSRYDGVQGALSVLTAEGYLHSYVLSESAEAVDTDALRRILVNTLPDHMIPDGIVVLGAWPMTANGKIDKKALPAPQLQSSTCFEAPTTQTQIWLVQCIAQLLNLDAEQISIGDNFFALGGHSLLAVKLVAQVRRALGKELSVQAVFESNDLKGLAQQITQCSSHTGQDIAPIARAQTRYVLSHAQQRLWFIDRLQGGSPEYNMAAAFEVEGHFNVAIAEQALLAIIMRHEVLRSVMCEVEGVPAQQILDAVDFTLHVHDLTSLPASEQALAVTALVERDKQLAFDLSQDVMLRAAFIDLAPARGVLVLNLHHIAGDGWSIPLLVKEFEQGYRALLAGEDTPLAPLPIQYIDYAHWQREPAQRDVFAMQLAYWQGQLADVPTVHELPLDGARSAQTNRDAALWQSQISTQDYQQITQQASRQGMSVFMLLHSAVALVLSRHSHSSDSVMGTPVANRQQAQLSELLGFFVNTVVLRVDTAQASLADYWAHVKATHLAAQAHQDVPFEQVVEQCCEHRSQLHSPLFQISFDVQFDSELAISLPDVSVTRMAQSAEALKFELEITVQVSEQGVTVNWLYDRQLFNSQRIERLSRHFTNVVHEMGMAEATQTLAQIPMLESDEQQALLTLGRYQGAYQVPTQSIHKLFEHQVDLFPNHVAISYRGETLTYKQLNERANALAHTISAMGVEPGSLIGVCIPRCPQMMVAILAILKTGAAYVPLDPTYPASRIALIIQDAALNTVLSIGDTAICVSNIANDVINLDDVDVSECNKAYVSQVVSPDTPAYVNYTSGTTGKPKGVVTPHRGVCRLVRSPNYCELNEHSRVVHFASISFDAATFELWGPLLNGGRCIFYPEQQIDLPVMNELLADNQVDTLFMTTGLFNQWSHTKPKLPALKRILFGGEVADKQAAARMLSALPDVTLVNVYGPTENTTFTSFYEVPRGVYQTPSNAPALPIGSVLNGSELIVVARDGSLTPQGGIGELLTGGDGVALGYLNQQKMTEERFIRHPVSGDGIFYKTGDLVRYNDTGELDYIGRADNQIKLRGYRIELGEIEHVLVECEEVESALVLLKTSSTDLKQLIAYVCVSASHLANSMSNLIAQLQDKLTANLPKYMIPAALVPLTNWPLTSTGKINREALPEPELAEVQGTFVEANTQLEGKIRELVARLLVLDEEKISMTANFFELGGHSLLATRLVSELEAVIGKRVPIKAVFEHVSLRSFASYIEQIEHVQTDTVETADRNTAMNASYAQQRLWFLDHLQGGSPEYNISEAIELQGGLQLDAVRKALQALVARHEVLRTTYTHANDQVLCVIHPEIALPLEIVDLSTETPAQQNQAINELVAKQAECVFDLSKDMPLRVMLVKKSAQNTVLVWTMHHIATDGWSLSLLIREFTTFYSSYLTGEKCELPELEMQYVDYAHTQRTRFEHGEYKSSVAYWQTYLDGIPDVHSLPLDFPRPVKQRHEGEVYTQQINPTQLAQLNALASAHQVTLFMLLETAFALVLSRFSGETDIVIGTPIAGREHKSFELIIGLFVNTLVNRINTDGIDTFDALLAQVKSNTLAAYEHQQVPFDAVVEAVNPERSSAYNPLCQIKFVLQNFASGELVLPHVTIRPYDDTLPTQVHFDLDLTGTEREGALLLEWTFKKSLFKRATIARMASALNAVLDTICKTPSCQLRHIEMVPAIEKAALLQQGQGESLTYDTQSCLVRQIEEQVEKTPHAIAVCCDELSLTYEVLNRQANKLAWALDESGVEQGECVGLYLERSIAFSIALLAVQKLGVTYVVLPTGHDIERINRIVKDAQIEVVLQAKSHGLTAIGGVDTFFIDEAEHDIQWLSEYQEDNPRVEISPSDIAYILYTSGSTGTPKGVEVTQQGLLDYCQISAQKHYRGNGSLVATATTFDLSIPGLYVPLMRGGCVNLVSAGDELTKLAALLSDPEMSGHFIRLTPSHIQGVLPLLTVSQSSSEHVFVIGGERFDVSIAKQMQTCFVNAQIYNHYGPTETVVGAVCYDVSANIATLETEIPIGTALPNTSVYVLDQHMDLTPIGVPGEIYIGGTRVAKGYLNQPEMTDARFIDSPFVAGERLYRTGDRARLLPDGNIAFISRMDDQVKIRGYRIELGEIEQQLLGHSAVSACVAHVWEEAHQAQLVAYVVLDNEVESQVLQTYLQAKLPHYMIPSAVVTLASLPLSANGKVNRKQLTKPQNNVSSTGVFSSPTEVMLADIWRRALNIEQLSPSDDFFALGGHSLIATRVVSDITKLFNKPITVSEFFDCRTLHKMAKHIDAMERKDFKRIPHCLRETDLALSFSQQRLWFIDQLEKNSSQYNMPMALMLSGDLNVGALHAALNALVNRHEVLRTCYHKKQGQPIQVILPEGQVAITQEDLQAYDEQEQLQRLSEIEANEWLTGFDLQSDMMFRAKLVQLAPTRHALFITLHHIASDGWSNGILVKEFAHLYQCFHSGTDSQLAPLPIQYADYAMWQRQQLNAHELDKQLSYWSSQLAELPIVHGLPLDKPRPQQQQFDAQSYDVCLSEAVLQRLQQFALDNGATLFMLLEVLFAAVVARFSNEDDIVIGTPISGRNHKDVEPLIGLFVNTLLLRTDLSDNPSFVDLLQQSKETSLAAYAHQDVPFDMLVDKLNPDRQLNHAALFQILFSMRNNEQVSLSLPALTIEDIPAQQELSKFDLQLSATESKQGLELSWRYATSIFERTTITRLSDAYNALLSACVEDPQAPVKSIPLISEAAHENIVTWELGQQVPCTTLLHHAFEQQAEAAPQRIALSDGSMALDYHTVNKMANQLAHYLCAQNVKPEDKIALLLNRSCMSIVCILAILKAGAAYVPIDTASPNELTEQIVADSDSVLLLCDADISLAVSVNRVNVKDLDLSTFPADNPLSVEVDATQLAYVIYTSGSSGKPKGVMVEHASLANLAANLGPKGIDHTIFGGCFALSATYAFDSSIKALVQLAHGAEIYVLSDHQKMNISALKHLLLTHERSITVMDCTPSLLEVWLGQGLGEHLPNLLIGGEAISDALWQRLVKWQAATGKKALNVYGPTECTVDTTWALIKGQKAVIGRPLNNVRIYVLDAHMQRVPVGVSGELYIGGAGVARGYINNAQLTQQQFVIDPFNSHSRLYKTGDKVRWSESGCLEFIGRIDNQVKIRGYRIELAHIEQQLLCVKKVTDAVVHVVDIQGSQQIVAYVVLDSHEQNIQGIEQSLARQLPSYMLPSAIIAIQKIPLTRNGKVDYDALPLPDYDFSAIALLPAQTPTEKALAGIWKNTLGVEEVGRNSGFFELGGHSIMAIKLVSDIASELGKTVTVRDVFENQQLEAFASYLDTLRVEYQQHISAISKDEPLVLSYAQQRIWFIDQLEGGSAQYNISMPVKLVGELHVPGLQRALSELVKRHEILRTVYLQNDEGTYQFVTSHYDVPLVVEDISALTASAKQAALRQAVNSETEQAFDLSSDMMIRARLIKLNEGEHALVFTIHHIATDGWSNSLLLNDFANLYQQQVAGEKSVTLPEMPIQYADFAFWQRTYFSDEHLTQQLNYWKQQLASLPTLHTLPTDKRRPAQQQLGAQKHLEVIDRELLDSLQKLATGYDTTLFTVIHTAFSILLGRLSGEDDIVIGSPIAGRNLSDIQNVSGCFINTLVLRTSLAEHQTFEAFLQHCKAVNLDAMSHQDLPFDLLVDELNPERSLSHAPVFQILLSMQNYEQQTIELPELRLQKLIEQDVKSKFDIQLVVGETEGQLEFTWVYATALFNAQTMTRFASALTSILQQVAQDVEFNIRSFPLFDDVSRSQTGVRELANRARTLIDYIEAQVLLTPNNIAVRDAQTTLTYHQLNEHSNRLASALLAHGVSPEQKVGVCLARSTELLIALLAVQKIAATYVMLSIGAEQQRLEGIIEDAEIQVVLHDGQSGSSLPHKVTLIEISNEALRTGNFSKHAAENPEVERNTAHSAYILYTSGSTGKPKGVEISQLGLNDYCQLSSKHHYPGDGSVVASAPVFDLTIPGLYVPLLNGGCVHLLKEGNELNDLALFLAEHDDSSLLIRLTPSHVQGLLPLIEHQIFIAQHVFVIGGERFAPDLAKRLQAQFAHSQIINHYGPTETVVGAMSFDVTSHEAVIETEIPIGKPLPNTEVMILDTSGARVPTGVPGELCIASPRVAKGYLNRPQLNQSVFVNNPYVKDAHSPYARMYRTGDKVRELADGNIAFMGRLDRQVKVRGFRVELAEIELQISAYRDVEQAAVKVFEEVENTILASYLVVKNEFDERAFMAFLKHRLPSYMIPTSVQVIDAMPLNNNGKVNLHALARPQNIIAQFTPPETDIEHRLVSIWQDVLQREAVSITANFFDLGGNSLLGTRVINAVQKEFDIELPLRSLFEQSDIRSIATLVEALTIKKRSIQMALAEEQQNMEETEW